MNSATRYFTNDLVSELLEQAPGVVFDLNGLLIDDEPLQLKATNLALSADGIELTKDYWISHCVGHHPSDYLPSIVGSGKAAQPWASVLADKNEIYQALVERAGIELLRPGVADLLEYLRIRGKPRALATSTTRHGVNAILGNKQLRLAGQFDAIICGDDVSNAKPHPAIYLAAQRHLMVGSHLLAIEDSESGLRAAKSAGFSCIVCPNEFTAFQPFGGADAMIDTLERQASLLGAT